MMLQRHRKFKENGRRGRNADGVSSLLQGRRCSSSGKALQMLKLLKCQKVKDPADDEEEATRLFWSGDGHSSHTEELSIDRHAEILQSPMHYRGESCLTKDANGLIGIAPFPNDMENNKDAIYDFKDLDWDAFNDDVHDYDASKSSLSTSQSPEEGEEIEESQTETNIEGNSTEELGHVLAKDPSMEMTVSSLGSPTIRSEASSTQWSTASSIKLNQSAKMRNLIHMFENSQAFDTTSAHKVIYTLEDIRETPDDSPRPKHPPSFFWRSHPSKQIDEGDEIAPLSLRMMSPRVDSGPPPPPANATDKTDELVDDAYHQNKDRVRDRLHRKLTSSTSTTVSQYSTLSGSSFDRLLLAAQKEIFFEV